MAAGHAYGAAVRADPTSTWPHVRYGRWLAGAGRSLDAALAYERAIPLLEVTWEPIAARPRLLAEGGRPEEAAAARAAARAFSHAVDPWLLLEAAWRALPAPVADEVPLARADYGAVRDFLHPRADHRWSRACGEIRLRPATAAARYVVELEMGLPSPAAPEESEVRVRIDGNAPAVVRAGRALRAHTFAADAPADGVLDVQICAPPWSRAGQPAAQGVAVRTMRVRPAAE
jgi:hypothetical protein